MSSLKDLEQLVLGIKVKVLQSGLGPVSLSEVNVAMAAEAHLIVFNQDEAFVDKSVEQMALQRYGLSLVKHDVIYHLLDQVLEIMEEAAPMVDEEVILGRAQVLTAFPLSSSSSSASRKQGGTGSATSVTSAERGGGAGGEGAGEGFLQGAIAGVRVEKTSGHSTKGKKQDDGTNDVQEGSLGLVKEAGSLFRVVREGRVVYEGRCTSLKRNREEVEGVAPGSECGIVLGGGEFAAYKRGDWIECYRVESRKQSVKDAQV